MRALKAVCFALAVFAIVYLIVARIPVHAQSAEPEIDANDIGGVVTSAKGPEAGVWVIAETTDLPTRYIKEVVTDDRGRYVLPDLPKANYSVWARGYGMVDSPKVQSQPGKIVDLKPTVAPDRAAAAQYYPANYWYALLNVPERSEFPGTGLTGNGISPTSRARMSGFISSRPIAANPAINSAANTRVRFRRSSRISRLQASPGCAASNPGKRDRRWSGVSRSWELSGRPVSSAIGPIASRTASFRLKRRRARRAWSATW
jgi:hypothetical protein